MELSDTPVPVKTTMSGGDIVIGSSLTLPCACGACDHVILAEIDGWGEDPIEYFLEFTHKYVGRDLRDRIKAAWKVLRGDSNMWFHSIMWEPKELRTLRDYLTHLLEVADGRAKESDRASS